MEENGWGLEDVSSVTCGGAGGFWNRKGASEEEAKWREELEVLHKKLENSQNGRGWSALGEDSAPDRTLGCRWFGFTVKKLVSLGHFPPLNDFCRNRKNNPGHTEVRLALLKSIGIKY